MPTPPVSAAGGRQRESGPQPLSPLPRFTPRRLLETVLLAAAGVLGNVFSVSLFFGVEVQFGSIAALLAVARLGLLPGLVVAVAGGAYTLVLWSHPYALVIFALEAVAVGLHRWWCVRWGRPLPALAVSAALYWLLVGIPLVLVFYHGPLGMGWLPTLLIAVKQSLNGILNAALAGSALVGLALLHGRRGLPRLSELLFSLLLSALLLPAVLVTAWENSGIKTDMEADQALELRLFGALAHSSLEKAAAAGTSALADALARLQGIAERNLRGGAAPSLYLVDRRSGEPTVGDARAPGPVRPSGQPGLAVVLPAQPRSSAMVRWRASRYRSTVPLTGLTPPQDLVVETSTAPVIAAVQSRVIKVLAALLALGLGAVALAHVLSRRIVGPIAAVADAARALPAAIGAGRAWSAPTPGLFAESEELGEAVRLMGESLSKSFADLKHERDEQARRRMLLDLEAQSLAWLVRDGEDAAAFAETLCRQLCGVVPGQHCLLLPGADDHLELIAAPNLSAAMREALRELLATPAAAAFMQRVLASGETAVMPAQLVDAHGAPPTVPCTAQVIPIRDREERGQAVLLTDVPITGGDAFAAEVLERVRTLAGLGFAAIWLRRHHGVLLDALSQSGTGIVVAQRRGRDHLVTYTNRGFEELSGYDAAALHGQDLRMLRDGDADQPDLAQLRAALAADAQCRAVIRNRRPDGSTYWNALALSPVRGGSDGVTHYIGVQLDVTEQRRTEAALREQQERYRLVVENMDDLLVRVDTDGRFEFVSPSYCRMFGRSEAELIGRTFMPLVHPDDRTATAAAMEKLFMPPYAATMEQRAETVHGWRWLQWSDKAVLDAQDRVVGIVGVGRDITERKAAEEALRESEQRFRALFETIGEGVIYYDGDGVMTEANPTACALLALRRDEVRGRRPESEPWQLLREDGTALPHADYPSRIALRSGRETEPLVVGLRADDSVRWLLAKAHPETAPAAPRPHRVFVTFADITNLLETQHRLQAIIDSSPHGIVEMDLAHRRVLWCNAAMERLFGYPQGGLVGLCADDLHPADADPQLVADLGTVGDDADVGSLNVPLYVPCRRRDGSRFHCKIAPGLMQLGAKRTLTAFFTDVTLEYQSRNGLEASRQALLRAQALAHIGSWEYDIGTDDLRWSPEVYRIFEQDPASFGASFDAFQALVHPDDRAFVVSAYVAAVRDGADYDLVHRLLLPDGRVKWVHERAEIERAADGTAVRARGTVQDITEHHLAQQQLRESREQLSTIFDNAPIGIALLDEERRLLMVNRALAELVGRSADALRACRLDSLVHADDLPAHRARFGELLAGRRAGYRMTTRCLTPDGGVVWGDLRMALLPAVGDAPPTPLAMVEDVTELHAARERRRALEETLSAYTARLEDLLELVNQALPPQHQLHALLRLGCRALGMDGAGVGTLSDSVRQPELVVSTDADSRTRRLAVPQGLLDAALADPGQPVAACGDAADAAPTPAQGCRIALVFAGDDTPQAQRERLVLVLWGRRAELALDAPLRQVLRLVAQRIAAVRTQERMQRYLVQAKERETIGHLASGVAHDFNNLLGVLDINLFYIEDALLAAQEEDPELPQVLEETRSALEQAKVVTSGMLSLSRAGGVPLSRVRLDTGVDELAGILRHVLPAAVRLETEVPAGLTAWSNGAFLQAALLNLALNARDAMPEGGQVRIHARRRHWDGSGTLVVGELAAGDYVEVSVADDGNGMSPQIQASIFEPLFSTKTRRRGHGLGLFMVKEFVVRSGAGLALDSAPGQGTRFRLLLPAEPPQGPGDEAVQRTARPESLAGLRVLVVDDDPRVREAVGRLLRAAGAETAFAEHGEAALARLQEDALFDLVLTDIAMPVMDGPTLHAHLRAARPDLAVVMMTGQAGSGAAEAAGSDMPVLRKPLAAPELYAAIGAVCPLDGSDRS